MSMFIVMSIFTSELFPPNFRVLRKDRRDGYGGVLLAVRNDFVCETIAVRDTEEHIYIKLSFGKNTSLIVGAVYRPPSSDAQYMDNICSTIEDLAIQNRKSVFWIGGDFNLPDINWEDLSIRGHSNPVSFNNRFLDMIQSCNMQQMVSLPTRGDSVLDLFLTNRPTLINKCIILPGLGDHDIVSVDSNVTAKRSKPVKRKVYIWKQANLSDMREDCSRFQQEFLNKYSIQSSVHEMWDCIKSSLLEMLDTHVPSKTTSCRFSQPWVTRTVKRMSRRKKRAFNRARATGREQDFSKYRKIKKSTRTACQQAYNEYINDIISPDSSASPKKFWSFINSKRNDSTGVAPLKDMNGKTVTDSTEKANILNQQFTSVFNKHEDMSTMKDKGPSPFPDMDDIQISPTGVYKLLSTLQVHKAAGPDRLPAQLLKELSSKITPVLCVLFQASIDQAVIPEDWKKADVVPVFKKGDRCKAVNYRPVSLTSIICKTLEHIVSSRIHEHLDDHNILSDAQHGFRKRRSCTSQLILTMQDLFSGLEAKDQTDVILLDMSKAFDKVPHGRLMHKIHYYGIRGNTHCWIRKLLSGRSQRVLLNGCFSHTCPVLSGVPQGSVTGPLLFLLFINDLPSHVSPGTTVRLFADDCILYRKVTSPDDARCLQQDLDALQEWATDSLMQFHPQKCQVMHVSNKRQTSIVSFPYDIHGERLQVTDSTKYLGVNLQSNLKWNHHVDAITKKANSVRGFLQRNMRACPPKTKVLLYKTLILPVLEYAAVVWDPSTQENIRKLEMVQRRSARFVLDDYRRTSSVTSMLHQLQWPSLQERRAQQKVYMIYSILHGLVDLPSANLIPVTAPRTRGNPQKLLVPYARTRFLQTSFYPDAIRLWNSLPPVAVNCTSLEPFKLEVQCVKLR